MNANTSSIVGPIRREPATLMFGLPANTVTLLVMFLCAMDSFATVFALQHEWGWELNPVMRELYELGTKSIEKGNYYKGRSFLEEIVNRGNQEPELAALVPAGAQALFYPAWRVAALSMPLNSLSFATDGIHWGSGDYRFLRNVMMLSTMAGAAGILLLDESSAGALTMVWVVTAGWITLRAVFGLLRIWPGIGAGPFRDRD